MSIYKQDAGQILFDGMCISNDRYLNELYYVQDDLFFPFNYTLDDLFEYEAMMYKKMNLKKFEHLKTYFKMDGQKKIKSLIKRTEKNKLLLYWQCQR
jgi:ABC-2 type transport system ATP-binding protein